MMAPKKRKIVMRLRTLAALAAVVALAAGCSASGGDKSGGSGTPQVLVLASNDGVDLDGAPAVQRFVDGVAKVSNGRLTVRVEPEWQGGDDEARVIKDVGAGKADLGWAGTRAFDLVDLNSFRPLHAPFLVDSYAAEAAVVKDPLAKELLASTAPLGLTGLALAADQLRFPAGVAKPLLVPADFAGHRFRTLPSQVQSDGIRALGAEPTSQSVDEAMADGKLAGLESMWWTYQQRSYWGVAPFITANAAMWPRTLVIFGNTAKMAKLDKTARGWLTQAATDASAWSTTHAGDADTQHIKRACQFGARIAFATSEQLAALRKAAEPAYAAMRADPALAATLQRVEALAAAAGRPAPLAVPAGCAYQPGDETRIIPPAAGTLTGPGASGDLPQGVYRFSQSKAELRDLGLTDHDSTMNAGVVTWTMRGGSWTVRLDAAEPSAASGTCEGWYDVHGDAVTFVTNTKVPGGTCAPPVWTARWSAQNGTLTWRAVSIADYAAVFAAKPWQKIG
jgi:TRAP-type C4-dicarboxylate transport system substrate-binding protein